VAKFLVFFFEQNSEGVCIPTTHNNNNNDYSLLHLKNFYPWARISQKYYSITHDCMKKRMINQ
jgi:hypothetical protein